MTVQLSIKRSSDTFLNVVWPEIGPIFGNGQIIPVETVTDSHMAKMLDVCAGVDMWMLVGQSMYAVASRVQYGRTAWNTFTVRRSLVSGGRTEFHKRRDAITSGALFPKLTVQAYVDGDRLLSVAAVDTVHLFDVCEKHPEQRRRAPDGNEFLYVKWDQCAPGKIITHRPVQP